MYVYNFRAEVFRVRHSLSSEVFFFSFLLHLISAERISFRGCQSFS